MIHHPVRVVTKLDHIKTRAAKYFFAARAVRIINRQIADFSSRFF